MDTDQAAVKIQALARGRHERKAGVSVQKRAEKQQKQEQKQPESQEEEQKQQQEENQNPVEDGIDAEEAAKRVQALARGVSVRKKNVLEEKRKLRLEREEQAQAAVNIQRHFRGYHLRQQMSSKDKEAVAMQFREKHEAVSHVKPEDLSKTAQQLDVERREEEADRLLAMKAKKMQEESAKDEEWAAVKIQSMYRGFSTRRVQTDHRGERESKERAFREGRQALAKEEEERSSKLLVRDTYSAANLTNNATTTSTPTTLNPASNNHHGFPSSSSSSSPPPTSSNNNNINIVNKVGVRPLGVAERTDHLMPDGTRPSLLSTRQEIISAHRREHLLSPEELTKLEYEKDKYVADAIEQKAMDAIKEATKGWSRKYVMHIEVAAPIRNQDPNTLRFLSVWSTPVLYRPVARTIVHVHFSVTKDSLLAGNPVISFRVENQVLERQIGAKKGVPLFESWLDRVVMDKEKLQKSFKLNVN